MLSRNGEAIRKRRHFPIKLPQFDVVAARELLGKYDGLIISAQFKWTAF
jgi:hypothetical protein